MPDAVRDANGAHIRVVTPPPATAGTLGDEAGDTTHDWPVEITSVLRIGLSSYGTPISEDFNATRWGMSLRRFASRSLS